VQVADRPRRRPGPRPLDDQLNPGLVVQRPPGDHAAQLERVADDAEVGQHRDAESLGHHQLAHLGAVRGIRQDRHLTAEQPVQVAVHDVAGAHADQRGRSQVGEGDLRLGGERAVRSQADDRPSDQQRGRLQVRRQVVAFQAVHQAEVGAAFQEPALDVGLQAGDHLHLGRRVGAAEPHDGGCEQRPGGRADRADPHHATGLVLIAGRLPQPVHRVEHGQHVRQQIPPAVAQPGALPAALQQVRA
jgi:hypothetical protein